MDDLVNKRRVKIEKDLFFEYEVSPHRAILARISGKSAVVNENVSIAKQSDEIAINGTHIPFRQIRSTGRVNPLKPPLDLETVLIGRALGQDVGYLYGVGFRIRDDGYVEGEFPHAVEKFDSFDELIRSVKRRLPRSPDHDKS
jgi:hypothetical protein